ncbi:MAG: tyrosine-type recombinase/integrase [Chloroflexota bacterium]
MSTELTQQADPLAAELREYLDAVRHTLSDRTWANYRRDLEEFAVFMRQNAAHSCGAVTRPLVRRWLSSLRARGTTPASIIRRASEVRTFLRFHGHADDPEADPFAGVRLPRTTPTKAAALAREDVAKLLATTDDSPLGLRDRALLGVLYATGLKVTELVELDVGQVDLVKQRLLRWGPSGQARPAFLGSSAAEALNAYLGSSRPALVAQRQERAAFVSHRGRRLTPRAVEQIIARCGARIGLRVRPSELRIACAVHLREGGATSRAIRQLLGTARLPSYANARDGDCSEGDSSFVTTAND